MTSFDPNHWRCTPEFIPPIHPPAKDPKNKYAGRCNTSIKTVKVAQNFYGVMHHHPLTGYKMPGAYGQTPVFEDLTTKQHFENQVRKIGEEVGPGDKRLVPYHPSATRNRPRSETISNVGLMCFDRRNASYFSVFLLATTISVFVTDLAPNYKYSQFALLALRFDDLLHGRGLWFKSRMAQLHHSSRPMIFRRATSTKVHAKNYQPALYGKTAPAASWRVASWNLSRPSKMDTQEAARRHVLMRGLRITRTPN